MPTPTEALDAAMLDLARTCSENEAELIDLQHMTPAGSQRDAVVEILDKLEAWRKASRRVLASAIVIIAIMGCAKQPMMTGIIDRIEQSPKGPIAVVEIDDHGHAWTFVEVPARRGWKEGATVQVPRSALNNWRAAR